MDESPAGLTGTGKLPWYVGWSSVSRSLIGSVPPLLWLFLGVARLGHPSGVIWPGILLVCTGVAGILFGLSSAVWNLRRRRAHDEEHRS